MIEKKVLFQSILVLFVVLRQRSFLALDRRAELLIYTVVLRSRGLSRCSFLALSLLSYSQLSVSAPQPIAI